MKLFILYFTILLVIMGDDMSPPKKMKKASVAGTSVKCNSEVSSFITSIAAKREKV